ncbi:hypothetical protein MSP8887_01427 [Marinomonas spartinae]|uniref:cache domain-containing protein n=1 Tax=Marinomonas spartinae TaxID=1792290 RepID=UPI000808D9B9|nr:cache domain-containing protein [Marinomonas spartinae]SBS31080.1 hypothetical protein MSP8887_01427 [Marinomonas spartinae]
MKNSHTLKTIFESVLCSAIFIVLLGTTIDLLYKKSIAALEDQIKIGLISSVSAAASTLDGKLPASFNDKTVVSDPSYQKAAKKMERIREATPNIRYIYTCILKNGVVYFMVNPSPQNDANGDGIPDTPPALMTPYTDAPPELKKALKDHLIMTSSKPYKDKWGTFISGYAPFYNHGKFIGVLAMDLELSHFYARLMPINRVFDKAKIIILFLGLIFGLTVWWIRRSHINHLNSNRDKEIDTTKRLSHVNNLNHTLSNLNHYFYLQSAQAEPENASELAVLNTLYQYAQSLKTTTPEKSQHAIQTWFKELDSMLKPRQCGHIEWQISFDTMALFPSNNLAGELATFHRQLSEWLQTPIIAETKLTEERLDVWTLNSSFQPLITHQKPRLEDSTTKQARLERLFFYHDSHADDTNLASDYTIPEINLMTTINRLQHMGCQFTVHETVQIDMSWSIFKEKAE